MRTLTRAGAYMTSEPGAALGDAAGLVAICAMIFGGFLLPGVLF